MFHTDRVQDKQAHMFHTDRVQTGRHANGVQTDGVQKDRIQTGRQRRTRKKPTQNWSIPHGAAWLSWHAKLGGVGATRACGWCASWRSSVAGMPQSACDVPRQPLEKGVGGVCSRSRPRTLWQPPWSTMPPTCCMAGEARSRPWDSCFMGRRQAKAASRCADAHEREEGVGCRRSHGQ